MTILTKLNHKLGFTPTESRVILLLVSTFLIGVGIKIVKSFYGNTGEYIYKSLDSTFIALSDTLRSIDSSADSLVNLRTTEIKSNSLQKVNLNDATKEDLIRLPGIGEKIAERIISYRIKNGKFKAINDLNKIPGIGKKKLAKIKPFVTIGDKNE